MVEGASGFGTPAALGAPMLVSVGHPPMESVVVLLIFNTFATVWGAVGTPIWFGFGSLGLSEDEFMAISRKASICLAVAGFILIPFVLTILTPWKVVRENLVFVMLSLGVCIGPSVGIASFSYEFPSLIGGIIGCAGTAVLIQYKIGLAEFTGTKRGVGESLKSSGSLGHEEAKNETDAASAEAAGDQEPDLEKVESDQSNNDNQHSTSQ